MPTIVRVEMKSRMRTSPPSIEWCDCCQQGVIPCDIKMPKNRTHELELWKTKAILKDGKSHRFLLCSDCLYETDRLRKCVVLERGGKPFTHENKSYRRNIFDTYPRKVTMLKNEKNEKVFVGDIVWYGLGKARRSYIVNMLNPTTRRVGIVSTDERKLHLNIDPSAINCTWQ